MSFVKFNLEVKCLSGRWMPCDLPDKFNITVLHGSACNVDAIAMRSYWYLINIDSLAVYLFLHRKAVSGSM